MKSLVLTKNTLIDEVLTTLNDNGNGFLPIVNDDNKLIGVITDGDIRRSILNKVYKVEEIINKNPITARNSDTHVEIKRKLKELHRRHMPVLDEAGYLIEVVSLDEFEFIEKDNWVVIMAGGLGSRLGELTKDTPKPMINVGRKPILLSIIEHFKSQGFCRFILCINYKGEIIENFFKDGSEFGVKIQYTKESKRLGTAGALSLIDFEMAHPFFVVNGDVLTTINHEDFMNFHVVNKATATMCVKKAHYQVPYACVEFDSTMSLQYVREKPNLEYFVNTGMYILNPDVLSKIPKNEYFDMPELYNKLLAENLPTKVFPIDDYWLDLGKPEDLSRAQQDLTI